MKLSIFTFFLFSSIQSFSQAYTVYGRITDENNIILKEIDVLITHDSDTIVQKGATDKEGIFSINHLVPGHYRLNIRTLGFENYVDRFQIINTNINLGKIKLTHIVHELDEVKIVQNVLAMVQKDDTTEFNSGAYKVNPDADAADLIKKMPSIEINDKQVKAQGENVTKIMVDGKPFFGNDPYAALKNLPAEIINKVQVYNEKNDQEQFTGFSEGNTTKTINIITKPDKQRGTFGTIYAGGGGDNSSENKYGTGATISRFGGDRRITLTEQSNNVNVQDFTDPNPANSGSPTGISTTNAAGLNYSDKWGKKTDIALNYFFNEANNTFAHQLRKTYLVSVDSGQIYNETSHADNQIYSHRFNLRLNYSLDSMNSFLLLPAISFNKNNTTSQLQGNTTEDISLLNHSLNNSLLNAAGISFSNNLLFRHKFRKKGSTFSLTANADNNNTDHKAILQAQNFYYSNPALNDTLNQQTLQKQNSLNLSGNATYTESAGKNGILKLEYNITYIPMQSANNTDDYSFATGTYSLPDNKFSDSFYSYNTVQRTGGSYLYHASKFESSIGLNYQFTTLKNEQLQPVKYTLSHSFQNLLPSATFQYKFSKIKNLQFTYNTSTQVPSVGQLQNVVNNLDPLHLYSGNPSLKQPYMHNITIRYNSVNKDAKNNFSAAISGVATQRYITSNSIVADSTTIVQSIVIPPGSQFTIPENINGYNALSSNLNYGLPIMLIKCLLNLSLNTGLSHVPVVINNVVNHQNNKNGGLGVSVGSNISENIDFLVSSNTNLVSTANSINTQLNNTYINGSCKAAVNLMLWKSFFFNTIINYQYNSGLSVGFNQDYLLWNMSIGKKILKKHLGDIRVSVFDILNNNVNIQHSVTDTYIEDSRSAILQRYFLIVFTYKLRQFKK